MTRRMIHACPVAVAAFFDGSLPFLAISEGIDATLRAVPPQPISDVDTLVKRDLTARHTARRIMLRLSRRGAHARRHLRTENLAT